MSDLYNKLKKTEVEEETTSADIAFAPAMGFITSPEVINIKGKKKKPNLKEEIDKTELLKNQIIKGLENIITSDRLSYDKFKNAFKSVIDNTPNSVLLNINNKENSIKNIHNILPNDIGELELILTDIEEYGNITKYSKLRKYKYLIGCNLIFKRASVIISYFGYIDMNFNSAEFLYINDYDITEELIELYPNIIRSGKIIYTKNKKFNNNQYETILDLINKGEVQK